MNTLNGYAKSTLTNNYLLTAAGGHKSVADFLLIIGSQTVSGNKTFSGSTTIDDLLAGNLVVSGNVSFAQTINGNINWSNILSTPTTLNGYGITDSLYSNQVSQTLTAVTWAIDKAKDLRRGFIYNTSGTEYSYLFGLSSSNTTINSVSGYPSYGVILKMGYNDRYLRMLRVYSGKWYKTDGTQATLGSTDGVDWEKIYAGYADSSGNSSTVGGYAASSFIIDAGGSITSTIYSIACKRVFSGQASNISDAPVTSGWISGLVLGSNWNSNHYLHYLVEAGDDWYTTRAYNNSSAMINWKKLLNHKNYRATFRSESDTFYIKIKINSSKSWMLSFVVRIYQAYEHYDIVFSGYNYGNKFWYKPLAVLLSSSTTTPINVYFGYEEANKLFVVVEGIMYTGVEILECANGYKDHAVTTLSELFTITNESSLPSTILKTDQSGILQNVCNATTGAITLYRPWYRNETVTNATNANNATNATNDSDGSAINTTYLKKSGGTMTGALTVPSLSVTGAATFSQAINGSILGNAATASRLLNTRTITIGSKSNTFDGSGDISFTLALIGAFASSSFTLANIKSTLGISDWALAASKPSYTLDNVTDGTTRKLSNYLPLSGGTLNDTKLISRTGYSVSWYQGRISAIIKSTSYTGYNAILSMKTTNGSWDLGVYTNDTAYLTYITDTNYNNNSNTSTYQLVFPKDSGTFALTKNVLALTGTQTVSGNKTFSGSTTLDDVTIGNLVVTGGASFAQTINGNAETASRFANSITIWGLSFDGSSNIASDLVMPNGKSIIWYDSSSAPRTAIALNAYNLLTIGYGTSAAGYNTELNGNNIYLKTGTGHTTALTINDSQQATFAGMINTIAAQATEGSTLAATTAGIDLKNSNLKGLNGIYFADESNVINEGIHFIRGDQTNKVDTLLSYRGNLYYRTNRELGTTKDDTATTSANIIVHSGNVGSYHQKHTVSRFISGNGTTDNSNIYRSETSMNGYWLGDLEYTGQTLTFGYPANNSTKYTFTTTNKSDIVIIDTEDWAQIFLSVNKPAGTVIDIYTCANTHLNFKVMASYNGTTRKVIISYADSYTVCTESNYSNIYYWWYNTSVNSGTPPGTGDYPRAKCLWFDIINRGVVRIVYTGTDIYIFKLCAFPA